MREDLKATGLDREIEANGHKSYRLAIAAVDRELVQLLDQRGPVAPRPPPPRSASRSNTGAKAGR